jgi:hypothetical protein
MAEQWDDPLRIGGPLKQGRASAALLIARLQANSSTRFSTGGSGANWTGARLSMTYATSFSSPTAAPFTTPTTMTRRPPGTKRQLGPPKLWPRLVSCQAVPPKK